MVEHKEFTYIYIFPCMHQTPWVKIGQWIMDLSGMLHMFEDIHTILYKIFTNIRNMYVKWSQFVEKVYYFYSALYGKTESVLMKAFYLGNRFACYFIVSIYPVTQIWCSRWSGFCIQFLFEHLVFRFLSGLICCKKYKTVKCIVHI